MKKTLKVGVVAGVASLSVKALNTSNEDKDVLVGKSKKKEVLYKESKHWQEYYKIAY